MLAWNTLGNWWLQFRHSQRQINFGLSVIFSVFYFVNYIQWSQMYMCPTLEFHSVLVIVGTCSFHLVATFPIPQLRARQLCLKPYHAKILNLHSFFLISTVCLSILTCLRLKKCRPWHIPELNLNWKWDTNHQRVLLARLLVRQQRDCINMY